MRRLITALLCLFTLSGAYAGHAQASQKAGLRSGPASIIGLSASYSGQDQAHAADPVWAEPAPPIVLAPTGHGLAPNAAQTHVPGFVATTWATSSVDPVQDRAAASRNAGWAVISRGYRATGPPVSNETLLARTSLARPA